MGSTYIGLRVHIQVKESATDTARLADLTDVRLHMKLLDDETA